MAKIFVKPAVAGHVVRHPDKLSHILAAEGELVEHDVLWERKIMQGDVIVCEEPKAPKPAAKSKLDKEGE